MDFDHIKHLLLLWMKKFVEKPNSALGEWSPCPYAKSARLNNKIAIISCFAKNLTEEVNENLSLLETSEVVVICFDHNDISASDCELLVEELNSKLMYDDYVILEDHPDSIESVSGVRMNFGECGLFVIQKLSKLNEASNKLKSAGYYDYWDQKSLDNVVTWRYKLPVHTEKKFQS